MNVYGVIVAAGSGTRAAGRLPKQFSLLGEKPLFRWSVDEFLAHPSINATALVVPEAWVHERIVADLANELIVVSGGESRSASVLNGLNALTAEENDIVLIHDAARPGLKAPAIDSVIEALSEADAAAPALVVSDALKRRGTKSFETVSRENLFRVQTPQGFRMSNIRAALSERSRDFVDDLEAIEALGGTVVLVDGDPELDKVTYARDIPVARKWLRTKAANMRIGSGFDVHGFTEGDNVILCGTKISHNKRLSGHSDADVGWHALTDAILGALGLGDLGDHFSPDDPKWEGADSAVFLQQAAAMAGERGWKVSNCDITLICEAPKIKPHREAMRTRTAEVLGADVSAISIKATTTEKLGFLGRSEGIAAQAVVMLQDADTL